jgi:N-acetylneuraminate lyase
MGDIKKYQGIFPAFYACYDDKGEVSPERVRALTKFHISKGVKGVYVGGSSGECIYQTVSDRKTVLENVVEAAEGKLTIIAHVACNSTKESIELAKHAESLGVDAIASIPPIYFHLPEYSIAGYWNDMSAAAPNTDFIIYNIPQLAGVSLTMSLLKEMLKNPKVIGVKNSSMPVQDIQMFKDEGTKNGRDFVVFNGPDEQLISGLVMGADGGIGGTYGAMPELILKLYELFKAGKLEDARAVQYEVDNIIYALCASKCSMYASIKEVLKRREGLDIGGVRKPFTAYSAVDDAPVANAVKLIDEATKRWIG